MKIVAKIIRKRWRLISHRQFFPFLGLTFAAILFGKCDAPRQNPLDPENPNSTRVLIDGNVQTFSVPREVLSGVNVRWANDAFAVSSGANGDFSLQNLIARDGWLFFEKPGYHKDSILISWNGRRQVEVQRFLNAEPQLSDLQIYSVVTNKFPTIKEFTFSIRGAVDDVDNDIDSVYWQVPALAVGGDLRFNAATQQYETDINPLDQGLGNEQVVGYDFEIFVLDKFERVATVGSDKIVRVIKEDITLLSPLNGVTVGPQTEFRWQRFDPGFFFTFEVEILQDIPGELPVLYRHYLSLSANNETFVVPENMEEGSYFWSLWVVDEFNNRARSRVGSFTVENP